MDSLLLHQIPNEIIQDMIIPFTYHIQSEVLLEDIRSYYTTMEEAATIYSARYPYDTTASEDDGDRAWLSNDICRFLNNDQPTMNGYVPFYISVYKRLYMNLSKDSVNVNIPSSICEVGFNDIKVAIGLLLPEERVRLNVFLMSGQ